MQDTSITRRPTLMLLVLLSLAVGAGVASAAIRNVSNTSQLNTVMGSLVSGDEVVLAPGTYNILTGGHTYGISVPNVTIRGATGNRDDVILYGGGINNPSAVQECLQIYANDVTIKDLTISDFYMHAIHFQPNTYRSVINNVHTLNNGEQHMKGAVNNYDGVIENCLLEQTVQRDDAHPEIRPNGYVGGIDLHGAIRFNIHDNVVSHIKGLNDYGDAGIFLWNNSQNNVIERNLTVGCQKGIALGNYSGNNQGTWNCQDTIVRNNFVVAENNNDIGIELWYTKNCKILYNTVYRTTIGDPDWFRTIQFGDISSVSFKTTNLQIGYNIVRGQILNSATAGATYTLTGNLVDTVPQPAWFVDPDNGNLHLTAAATAAINHGVASPDVLRDWDEVLRLGVPDVGADEYGPHAGDANQDGHVNVDDLGILASNYDSAGKHWENADFTHDYTVNVDDLGVLASNYDWLSGGSGVPEPATLSLLLAAALGLLRRSRRQ